MMFLRVLRSSIPIQSTLLQAHLKAPNVLASPELTSHMAWWSKRKRQFNPKHEADGVETGSELIYKNSNLPSLYAAMAVCVPTCYTTFGLSLYTAALYWDKLPGILFEVNEGVGPGLILGLSGVALVEAVKKVYNPNASRIYYNAGTGVFTLVPLQMLIKKPNLKFTARDVTWKDMSLVLQALTGNLVIKGRMVYILSKDFKHKSYYHSLTEAATRKKYASE